MVEFVPKNLDSLVNFEMGSNSIIAGPTSSGKTRLLFEIINEGIFNPMPEQIFVCAPSETCESWRKNFENKRDFEIYYVEGPKATIDAIENKKFANRSLLVFDDFTKELENKSFRNALEHVFHVLSHHNESWSFFVTHDLFVSGMVSLRRNNHNTFFFDVTNDRQAMKQYLNKLVGQEFTAMFTYILERVTSTPHEWLRFDTRLSEPKKILSTGGVSIDDVMVFCTQTDPSIF